MRWDGAIGDQQYLAWCVRAAAGVCLVIGLSLGSVHPTFGAGSPLQLKAVSVGEESSTACGIRMDDSLVCWGDNTSGQASPPAGAFKSVSVGSKVACAIQTNNNLVCWGGYGLRPQPGPYYLAVGTGGGFFCAIRVGSVLECRGKNDFGQTNAPVEPGWLSMSAGTYNACAVRTDATLACWGRNDVGQTIAPAATWKTVSVSTLYSCGIKMDDTVTCWGENIGGVTSPPLGGFKAIAAGFLHACGIRMDNTLACWGDNTYGEASPPDGQFKAVSAGTYFTCGIRADDTVSCWGANQQGQATPPGSVSTTPPPTSSPPVQALPLVTPSLSGLSAEIDVAFTSTAPGQGYVLFGPGPGCTGLIETATQDLGAGTAQHLVTVTGDDMNPVAGAVLPGATYTYEVEAVTPSGVQVDNNGGKCYTVTVPSQ